MARVKLSAHFYLDEFACRSGAPFSAEARRNLPALAQLLELLRADLSTLVGRDCPLIINSGFRTLAYHKLIYRRMNPPQVAPLNSQHLFGRAADVVAVYASARAVQQAAKKLQAAGKLGGLGRYPGFTHVDTGPVRTWQGT